MLANKLKAPKADLKIWNRDVYGHIGLKKQHLMEELVRLDALEYQGDLSNDNRTH